MNAIVRTLVFPCLAASLCLAVACGSDSGGSDATTGTDNSSATPACKPGTTDGRTACGSEFCEAGNYCLEVLCQVGCQSEANCPQGQGCDKSGSTDANGAGVCRACSGNTCDAQGNYTLVAQSSNPEGCPEGGTCSVTQSGTAVTVSCPEAGMSGNCTVGAGCTCSFSVTVPEIGPVTVNLDFTNDTASITAGGALCEYAAD